MKLFILGATGGIGRHLVELALEHQHAVTAYVRSPEKMTVEHEQLRAVQGDVFDAGEMAEAMRGHDAVLSAFGPTTILSSTLRRDFGRTLTAAMRKSGVRRVELVSAAFLFADIGRLGNFLKATLFRQMAPDMAAMEREVAQDDLDWTIVRPPRLTNAAARQAYRADDGDLPKGGFTISRADVAHFMIGEAEKPAHRQHIVGLAD